jgi:hypothetical protein
MQTSILDHDPLSDSALNATQPNSPEESADQFGIRLSLLIVSIGLFVAAVWAVSGPSFRKCSALENPTERYACYDNLRKEQSKPPAKGADAQPRP